MDFGTIKKKLNMNIYKNVEEFLNDMSQVFTNCRLYNGTESPVGRIGVNIRREYDRLLGMYNFVERFQNSQQVHPSILFIKDLQGRKKESEKTPAENATPDQSVSEQPNVTPTEQKTPEDSNKIVEETPDPKPPAEAQKSPTFNVPQQETSSPVQATEQKIQEEVPEPQIVAQSDPPKTIESPVQMPEQSNPVESNKPAEMPQTQNVPLAPPEQTQAPKKSPDPEIKQVELPETPNPNHASTEAGKLEVKTVEPTKPEKASLAGEPKEAPPALEVEGGLNGQTPADPERPMQPEAEWQVPVKAESEDSLLNDSSEKKEKPAPGGLDPTPNP